MKLVLAYKLEPVEKNYWLLFKLIDENGMDLNGVDDMGSDIVLEFSYLEHSNEDAEWFVSGMDIDTPQIHEISDVARMILEKVKGYDFTANVKSIVDFAEEYINASFENCLFSYRLNE